MYTGVGTGRMGVKETHNLKTIRSIINIDCGDTLITEDYSRIEKDLVEKILRDKGYSDESASELSKIFTIGDTINM